ncbi:1-deoxy-D-xylulose-5-phosphate synthase [Peptococcus simiae]|uniref:1-deoxy-D-xylulose-5-phosphate synthase n=1 Tax=Peptococcus simiae TaxID=1643805 RepID=A0ABW9GYU9_9FIRM
MLLDSIQEPKDLRKLSADQLNQLAGEIRERIIRVTSVNGGHLAPNLGAVELTLALHSTFHAPDDKIIWDVGHQAYIHKLLTGRNDAFFDTLRTYQGMSGFPKRTESPYDVFGTGHASTSISAATGFALARDLRQENNEVVAVIGDGALTGGEVFEAMNYAGHMNLNMKVILNDNDMSIDANVGGLSDYLTRLRSDPGYQRAKEDLDALLKKIPTVGPRMADLADRLKDGMKSMLVAGSFFEELGFKYFGPINGHDIQAMRQVFENAKGLHRPVLIHVITKKGKGYLPAELNPDKFHGTGPFDVETGQAKKGKKAASYTDVFAKTLIKLGKENDKICAITAAMGSGTGVAKFKAAFPNRAFDVGIAEGHATTMATALALDGMQPVLALYSSFMQRGFDQLIHDCALQEAPVVFALDRAGLVGEDGPTHHGAFDLSYLRLVPNMTVMAPKDERELQNMLYSALAYQKPTAIRYPRGQGVGVETLDTFDYIAPGTGEVLAQGKDACLVAIGSMVYPAAQAAEALRERGYDIGLVNARFAKPLDEALLAQVFAETDLVVTLEENALTGGFGAAVAEWAADTGLTNPLLRIGLPDHFVEAGNVSQLKKDLQLDPDGIFDQVATTLKGRQAHG